MRFSDSTGSTLIEVLVATAVASVVVSGVIGVLAASARTTRDSELESTAVWLVVRTIEQWRDHDLPDEGTRRLDRVGQTVSGAHLFALDWSARPDPVVPRRWRLRVTVTGPRLTESVAVDTLVSRSGS